MPEHTPSPTPSRGIYGFVLFLLFNTLFILYCLYAFVPTYIFENYLGITYLPDKYFALFVPILILTAANLFAFLIYPSLTMIATPNIDEKITIQDEYSVRRCIHRDSIGVLCDRKIAPNSEDGWDLKKVCDYHEDSKNFKSLKDNKTNYIADYCDCPNKSFCMLANHKNYIKKLRALQHIPNASDLDLSEVCKTLYLKQN